MIAALTLAALLDAMGRDPDLAGCSSSERSAAASRADVSTVGYEGGKRVVLAALQSPCFCGNVDCPYLVLRLDGSHAQTLLATFAHDVVPFGSATPLPDLRERAHDNALISIETIDTYRDGHYVAVSSARVRGDTGARKLDNVPVRFAPGASSATLHGSIAIDWYDTYAIGARAGQQLRIDGVPRDVVVSLSTGPASDHIALHAGTPIALPPSSSNTYTLIVDTSNDAPTPYALTLTIR